MIWNGKEEGLMKPVALSLYLKEKGYRTDRIAVELNGNIIPKQYYDETILCDTDRLEVVSFVGGG